MFLSSVRSILSILYIQPVESINKCTRECDLIYVRGGPRLARQTHRRRCSPMMVSPRWYDPDIMETEELVIFYVCKEGSCRRDPSYKYEYMGWDNNTQTDDDDLLSAINALLINVRAASMRLARVNQRLGVSDSN